MRNSFQGFKKVATDQHGTTFAHPNGSTLKIPHKGLNKQTLEKISKLPVHKAHGGQIQKYSGEDGAPDDQVVSADPSAMVPNYATTPIQNIALPKDWTPEDEQKARGEAVMKDVNAMGDFAHGVKRVMFDDWTKPTPAAGAPQGAQGQAMPQEGQPQNVNLNNQYQAAQQGGMGAMPQVDQSGFKYDPYQGINTQIAGAKNEANAIGDVENAKAMAFHEHQQAMGELNNQIQQNAWNNKVETDNWIDDMKNSHIDPKAYINNMSTGQKTATAIGMILGGISQGMLHSNTNPMQDILNKNIERDVNAQVENRENKKNIFNAMQKQYGNQQDALQMTRAFYLQKLQNDIGEAAAKSGSALAQARAQQAIGPLQQQLQQIHFDVGMRQAALKGIESGNSTMAAAALPYLVRDKAKVEDAAKAYGAAKSLNEQQANALKSFDQIHSMIGHGMFSPNDAASAKQAFVGTLQVALEHRYNPEAAAALGNALWPSKTDVSEQTIRNKRERLIKEFNGARDEHDSVLRALTGGLMGAPTPAPVFTKRK